MKTFLTKLTTAAISLATLLITGSALAVDAPVPAALWDGFNELTVNGYTWTKASTATINADGSLTVGSDGGLSMTFTSGNIYDNREVTLIIDMEAPSFSSRSALMSLRTNNNDVSISADGNTLGECWNADSSYQASTTDWTPTARQVIALVYKGGGNEPLKGTRTCINGVSKMYKSGCMTGSNKLNNLYIGIRNGANEPATGLKVYRAALFDHTLTQDEVAAFAFPPIPTAMWQYEELENPQAKGDYTLTVTGNTFSDNAITIGDSGLIIGKTSGDFALEGTVIIDVDSIPNKADATLISYVIGNNANEVTVDAINGTSLAHKWNHGGSYGSADCFPTTRSTVALAYKKADGNNAEVTYVNGEAKFTGGAFSSTAVSKIRIGSDKGVNTTYGAQGMKVYGVAYFTTKLTAAEIAAYQFPVPFIEPDGTTDENDLTPTFWYRFNGDVTPTGADTMGDFTAGTAYSTDRADKANNAIVITNGKTGNVSNLSPQTSLSGDGSQNGAFTVSIIAKVLPSPTDGKDAILWSYGPGNPCLGLYADAANNKILIRQNGTEKVSYVLPSADMSSAFHTYVVVGDLTNIHLYVDGVDRGSFAQENNSNFTSRTAFAFCCNYNNSTVAYSDKATGSIIDDWRVYCKQALTAEQVAKIGTNMYNPGPTKAAATIDTDTTQWKNWGDIQWDGDVKPSATLPAEITLTGSNLLTIMQNSETDAITAKGITFKGTSSAKLMLSPLLTYNGGKITSGIPFELQTEVSIDVDVGANDLTYSYAGAEISPNLTYTGNFTKGGTGTISLNHNVPSGKTLTVAGGTLKLAAGGQGIVGTLIIEKGATFVNLTGDGANYGGNPKIYVYGTLDMGNTRWTTSVNTFNFYPGSSLIGNGDGNAAIDVYGTQTYKFLKDSEGNGGTVTISGKFRLRNVFNVEVEDGMTAYFCCPFAQSGGLRTVNKSGAGVLKLSTDLSQGSNAFNINAGTLEVATGAVVPSTTTTIAAGATLKATGSCASNFTVNGALVFEGGSLTGTISGTPTSVTVQGETEATGYLAGATFDLAENATLVMSGAAEPLISGTINSVGTGAKVMLPSGFAFGTIANVGEGITEVTVVSAAGEPVTAAKVENGKLFVPKSEIVTEYDVEGTKNVNEDIAFGEGGSIVFKTADSTLNVTGTVTLPAGEEAKLPISFTLKGEYAQNETFTLITASNGIKKGDANAQVSDFTLTATLLEGMTGELQLSDDNTKLQFVITSNTITKEAADVLNGGHLVRRFDANRGVTADANNKVTAWTDLTGATAAASYSAGQVNDQPTLVSGGLRNYLDFGTTGSGKDLRFERLTNAKTVIEVLDIEPKQNAFLLGDSNNYNFHRGGNGQYGDGNNAKFSTVRDNGEVVSNWSEAIIPTGFRVISLKLSQNCAADCFSSDRNGCNQGRTGGRKLCELLVFDTELSDVDFAAVEAYLTTKWNLAYKNEATLGAGNTLWSALNWGADKSYVPGSPIEITIGADNARLIYDDATVPVDSIVFKNESGYTYSTAYGVDFGAKTVAAGETMTIVGGADADHTLVYAGALTVNGILKTEGYVKLSNNNGNVVAENTGTLEIVSGTTEAIFPDQGMKGTLTIDSGATFKPYGRVDAVRYSGNTKVNVYGILDMSDSNARWTLKNNNTMNFYTGSTIMGDGQSGANTGALQSNGDNCIWNFKKAGDGNGVVNFSAKIHAQNAFTMTVEEGVTVNMSGSLGTGKNPFTLTGAGTINLTGTYDFNAPVTISAGTKLIIDGGSCAGGYTNNGTIEVKNGNLDMGSKRDFEEFGTVTFGEQGTLSATATPAEYGAGAASFINLPESLTTLKFIVNGVEQSLTVSEGTATYSGDVVVDGFATWLDYTFTKETREARKDSQGYILNAGSAGVNVSLQYDTNYNANNSYNEENGSLLAKSTPWRKMSGTSVWPSSYTAVVYANVPDVENGCLVGFGSSSEGKSYVVIVRGEDSNTIKLMKGTDVNTKATLIVEMSALNATSSKHLIVFTNQGDKFTVYCDGVKAAEIDAISLGQGFQIGSVHGGVAPSASYKGKDYTGITRVSEIEDQTIKDAIEVGAIRVWDRLITDAEMDALVAEFPYINKAGLFDRTIGAATANLSEENAWANHETQEKVALPQSKTEDEVTYQPSISVETTVESTLTLNDSLTVDTATFDGDGTLTITAGESENTLTVGGSITVNSPIKIKYGEVNISTVPLKLGASGAVEIDLADCGFGPTVVGRHQLTGVTDEAAGKITIKNQPTAQYFKGELVHEDGSYWFKVSADYVPGSTLYLTTSTTLSDNTLYALTADGGAVVPRVNPEDIIYVKEGVTATLPTSALSVALGQFDGVGTIAVNGGTLKNSAPLFTLASTWTGTVEMTNIAMAGDSSNESWFSLNAYGNENSKVKLAGATGYMQHATKFLPEVVLENTSTKAGLEITAGASDSTVIFRKISGTGNLLDNPDSGVTQRMAVGDVSGFTGQVRALQTGGITLGSEENTAGNGQIVVANGTTIAFNGQMWEAANGVSFGETLDVVGAAGNYITMPEQTTLPEITVGGEATSLMLKYEEGKLMLAQAAASFDGVKYETLAEAITAANDSDEGGIITIYADSGDLDIEIADGKTITIACAQGVYVGGGSITKTGAGTLVLDGASASMALDIVVEEGELVLTDSFWLGGMYFMGQDIVIAPGATIEFRNNNDITGFMANFIGTDDGFGTVRKSGTGTITMGSDVFANFCGDIEFVAGGIMSAEKLSINKSLKIAGEAMVGISYTQAMTERLTFAEGATLDISERTIADPFYLGIIELPASVKYVFPASEQPENGFKIVNGALAIDADVVNNAIISINGVEYLATLTYSPDEQTGDGFVKYSNKMPIIRIVESMTSAEVNAKIAEIGMSGFATVYFEDEAELEMTDALSLQLAMVCAGNAILSGTGTINAGSIAFVGSTKTLDIGENVIFVPAIPDNLSTATITGEGTIVYDGALPGNEKTSYQNTANWTGTVWLKNYNYQRFDFGALGHSGSKVKLTHIWGFSPNDATSGANPEIVLVDEGSNVALEINDGHGNSKYFFRKLSGDGTFKTSGGQTTNSQYRFYDVSDFEGTFALNGNNKRVVIGTGSTDAGNGQILIDNTATVAIPAGKTWSANNGIKVDGTIAGAGILGSNTTFGNGATIDASAAQLTVEANKTLTFGSSLTVKLASAPEEDSPVKIMNGSFTEQTFETTLTVMVNDQQAEGDFAIKQDANGVRAIANTEVVWTGNGTDHNWSNPANWQGSVVPAAGRNVVIDVGEATDYSIVIDSNTAAIGSLTVTGAGVVFSGEGTINGPITFTTPKIAGSLKAVGDVTVSAAGAVEVAGGMDITGNLMFDGFSNLTFAEGTDISVSGDMTTTATDKHNFDVYFNAGSIEVAETLHTLGRNATYISYHYGDGASENTTMIVRAKTIDAHALGVVYNAYEFRSGATVYVGEGGFNIAGRTAEGETNMASATFNGGKYVATATSTFTVQKNYQVVADSTIEVVDGATLTINNSGKDFGQAGKKITKTGAGTLKFAGTVLTEIDVTAGAVEMTAGDEAGVTVSEGADLYLKVTAEQKEAGYTSTATIPTGTNISFILPNGTVVEGVGGILPPKTIVWVGDDQGSWDEPSNWSPAVVPLVDSIVSFAGEGEGTITIKISDGTPTIEGVSFNSSKNIAIDGVVNVTGAITKDGTGTLAINLGADNSNAIAVTAGALEVNVPQGVTRTLSGVISGSGKVVKTGKGTLVLSAANTFKGGLYINEGIVKAGNVNGLGSDSSGNAGKGEVHVANGATLEANGQRLENTIYLIGDGVDGNGALVNNGNNMSGSISTTIHLTGDASWGGSGYFHFGANSSVNLHNFTFTKKGSNAFPVNNTTIHGPGKIVVAEGIFDNNQNANTLDNIDLEVLSGATLRMKGSSLTIKDLIFNEGAIIDNNSATLKVGGTIYGTVSIPKLELLANAVVPVTSVVTAATSLTLPTEGTFTVDVTSKLTESGNFEVITGPENFVWDTEKVTLYPADAKENGWMIGAEDNKLVASKLPLNATVNPKLGDNFGEAVLEVNVSTIDSTMTGTKIKVVTTKDGDPVEGVDPILVAIDGSKGTYEINVGNLTKGETYDFNITFVNSETNVIEGAKVLNTSKVIANIIPGTEVFSADATGEEGLTKGGAWTEDQTITEGAYVIDDETPSVFNVTASTTGNYTIEYELTFEAGFTTELTAEETAPIAGITIGAGDEEGTFNWYRSDSTDENGWSKLDRAVTPGHYLVRMAFTDSTVTYSVKGDEDTNFVTLMQGATSAFTRGGTEAAAIQSVSFQGASALAKFGAKTDDTIDTTIANDGESDLTTAADVIASIKAGKTVTLNTNVAIDTSSLAKGTYNITVGNFNLSFVGTDTRVITFADGVLTIYTPEEKEVKNGQSNKVNQDLNLDPEEPTDIPFVKAINSDNPNAITFKLFHGTAGTPVSEDTKANANAKFFVESCDNASFTGDGVVIEKSPSAGVKNVLEVPLPKPESGKSKVRYYRLKFND